MKHFFSITVVLIFNIIITNAQTINKKANYLNTSLDFETRSLDLVQQMTLEEKIAQLGNNAPAIPRLGILPYNWWNESLHGVARAGVATVFPQAIGMAASFDLDMMKQVADIISDEARAKHHEALRNKDYGMYKGLTFWSPNINIFRDPRWGRGHETYGEDPYLTGQMGMQFVKGLQGDDPKYLKLVATAKHFAVHSGPEADRHSFNVVPNTRDLWETYLPAFKDLVVDAKAYSVMGAYNRVDGESASASWLLLEDILRNKWKFEGYVVSDCGAINDIHANHKIVSTAEESAALGVRKGCDLNCGSVYQESLKNAVELGLIDEEEINRSIYRLILARMKLGMFDPPENVSYAQIPYHLNDSETHDIMALKMAQKSMTLLKNDGILPLNKKKIKHIAVVGPNADNIEVLRANYYGEASHPVTVIEGLKSKLGNKANVTYAQGVPLVRQDSNNQNLELSPSTLSDVKNADVAIFVGGLDATWEGEEMQGRTNIDGFYSGDRTKIELPKIQQEALKAMIATGTPVVFVLMAGSSVALEGLDKELKAVLMGWYPGQRGGDAIADVLFGDYNPAGRLPVTFYSSTTELPDFKDYNMRAGKGFTYRYYQGKALYPFGHGLSYTNFEYSNLKIDKPNLGMDDELTVSVNVKNTGKMDGDEVVQLYIKDLKSDLWMPIKKLRKFERISLNKKTEKTVVFKLNVEKDLRYYDATQRKYKVEPGKFEIQIGTSSADIRVRTVVEVK
ncbi:glycoside hydrolase family 3 protein [Winogradskyella bathintestinalis]|uniref:Glycoside hydrolase family 3 C-terminal domain-containing protein n=1 Tax=Winogradskyella bathintestinalis TaxID=3035208 RepID=A0ABT7ZUP5_9FLAO|nr:glycoside hydrolase family 3 protein [Winogradskyella bathintestinalis]MDN3492726.1 glycoside hydrolase family 3 C-terminal domain-containing protein [Winogradskyella bathintestinalis]